MLCGIFPPTSFTPKRWLKWRATLYGVLQFLYLSNCLNSVAIHFCKRCRSKLYHISLLNKRCTHNERIFTTYFYYLNSSSLVFFSSSSSPSFLRIPFERFSLQTNGLRYRHVFYIESIQKENAQGKREKEKWFEKRSTLWHSVSWTVLFTDFSVDITQNQPFFLASLRIHLYIIYIYIYFHFHGIRVPLLMTLNERTTTTKNEYM